MYSAAQLQAATQQNGQIDIDRLTEIVRTKLSQEQQQVQAVQYRRQMVADATQANISLIKESAVVDTLLQLGIDPDEVFGTQGLTESAEYLRTKASEAAAALEDGMIMGDEADEQVLAEMVEMAIEDPVAASEVVYELTGEEVDPEELEAAAVGLVEAAIQEDEGMDKEAHVKLSQVSNLAEARGWSDTAQELVQLRAQRIAYHHLTGE